MVVTVSNVSSTKRLSELYIKMGEEALAAAVLDEVRDAMVER